MTRRMEGTLEGSQWNERDHMEEIDGVKVTLVDERFAVTGGLVGELRATYLMAYRQDGKVNYTGYDWLTVEEEGEGVSRVMLEGEGRYADGVAETRWTVVERSGTGRFEGARGTGGYRAEGHGPVSFWLELE